MLKITVCVSLLLSLVLPVSAKRFDDIQFEGLQRLSAASILNVITLRAGQDIKASDLSAAIKELYNTGNFEDVKIGIKENQIIISVIERPMIAEVKFDGNSLLPKEALQSALTGMGLSSGEILKRSTVAEIESELAMQYQMQGRYNASIDVKIKAKPKNRIDLDIKIDEGSSVKVEHIEIVGNDFFLDEQLLDYLDLKTLYDGGLKSWLNSADSFNEQVLRGNLEQLRSFYLDRGYLQFELDSVQSMLNDNKELVTIVANIREGEQFYLQSIDVAGKLKGLDEKVKKLLRYDSGELYSQKQIDQIIRRIQNLYDSKGYYYVQVSDAPIINEDNNQVEVVLLIDPGVKTFVRKIQMQGNSSTLDEVIRREFRQLEGTIITKAALNRSRARIQQLGFFKGAVEINPVPVPGRRDLVDIIVKVSPAANGTISANVSWQPGENTFSFGGEFSKDNFLGTGKKFSISATRTQDSNLLDLAYSDPYFTRSGGSRSISININNKDFDNLAIGGYGFNSAKLGLGWGYPISEVERINFKVSVANTELATNSPAPEIANFVDRYGLDLITYELNAGYSYSTVNGGLLANDGMSHNLSMFTTIPGSDVEYFTLSYSAQKYFKFNADYSLRLHSRFAYGNSYDDQVGIPFFRTFRAGGNSSVRGYASGSLGPRSSIVTIEENGVTRDIGGGAIGGNILTKGGIELLVPTKFLGDGTYRASAFVDYGNVFNENCIAGNEQCMTELDFDELRGSYGLSLTWQLGPLPLAFVLAQPINKQTGDSFTSFNFGLGAAF